VTGWKNNTVTDTQLACRGKGVFVGRKARNKIS